MKKPCNTCKHRSKEKPNYSKTIIAAMTLLWFIMAFFGMVIVCIQVSRADYSVALDSLLTYVGLPMSGGIVGYLIKSAVENKEKIRQNCPPQNDAADRP